MPLKTILPITLIVLLTTQIEVLGQYNYHEGNTLYVWAEPNLIIHRSNTGESDSIGFIPYGEKVTIENSEGGKAVISEIVPSVTYRKTTYPNYDIRGQMRKVTYKGTEGWIAPGNLSFYSPPKEPITVEEYFNLSFKEIKRIDFSSDDEEDYYGLYRIIYDNGVTFSRYAGRGSVVTYTFPSSIEGAQFPFPYNFSFHEVLLILRKLGRWHYKSTNSSCPTLIIRKQENELLITRGCQGAEILIKKIGDVIVVSVSN